MNKSNKKNITQFAEFMHDIYEKHSKKEGWKTQKKTRVPFVKLPKENKAVMIKVAETIINAFGGCTACYGKGFGTQTAYAHYKADFIGDKSWYEKYPTISFCKCERGKELMRLWHENEKIIIEKYEKKIKNTFDSLMSIC